MALFDPYQDPTAALKLPQMPADPTPKKGLFSSLGGLLAKADAADANGLTFWDRLGNVSASLRDDPAYRQMAYEQNAAKSQSYKKDAMQKQALDQANAQADILGLQGRERLVFMANPEAWAKENATRYGAHTQAPGAQTTFGETADGAVYNPRTFTNGANNYETKQGGGVTDLGQRPMTPGELIAQQRANAPALINSPTYGLGWLPQPGQQPSQQQMPQPSQGEGTRAARNNNAGNLRWDGKSQWQGMQGVDPQGFVQFDTPENGMRAAGINLANQQKLHGLNTLSDVITKYAPQSDGNNVQAYIQSVAQQTGIDPNQPIDLTDPAIQAKVLPAMFKVEGGGTPALTPQQPQAQQMQAPVQPQFNPIVKAPNAVNADAVAAPVQGGVTGEAFAKTLPGPLASQVKALSEGRMAFPTGAALRAPYWQDMLQKVSQYDPTFDAVNYGARAKTRAAFTSGKQAQNITSFNTAIGHLDHLNKAIDGLDNGPFPWFNAAKNAFAANTNPQAAAALNDFNTSKIAVVDELTRAFRGTGGNVHDLDAWEKQISDAKSPQELKSAVHTAASLLGSRIDALNDSYSQGMGRAEDVRSFMSPKAVEALSRLESESAKRKSANDTLKKTKTGATVSNW